MSKITGGYFTLTQGFGRKGILLIGVILAMGGWLFGGSQTVRADDFVITFEEPIPVPHNLRTQYCVNPDTNRGVEFKFAVDVFEPGVATASATHAVEQIPGNDDVDPYEGPIVIAFTTGQSHVGVNAGLNEANSIAYRAVLRAYDDPDPNEGTKLTPDPDPSVSLGSGPTDISQPLTFSTTNGEATIRRIEIEFFGPNGESGQEFIDDLSFSDIGPTCVTDTQAPTVDIVEPTANQTITSVQALLHYRAQDVGSGIARITVSALDAGGAVLSSGASCGGAAFPSTCPGTLNVDTQYYTFFPRDTARIRVEATDFAGGTGQDEVAVIMDLPDTTFNLWALGMEVTQGIQQDVPTSTESRRRYAPEAGLDLTIPMVANKRTVARVYPGLEGTTDPVVGARADLYCFTFLASTLGGSTPCEGPLGAEAASEEITVDPANNNDINTLRQDAARSWNFILPSEWTRPGQRRYLIAYVKPPVNLAECGSYASGCDDGANFFILQIGSFQETAPLIIKPRFGCVRRSSGVPRENCDSLASDAGTAMMLSQQFLLGNDWNGDGTLDPFFHHVFPVADGAAGVEILPPIINDYTDGDFSTASGILSKPKMTDYLAKICDEFIFEWTEIFTDPGEILAEGIPKNLRYLGFVPPPTGPSGQAYFEHPCGVVKLDLDPGRVRDDDFCENCSGDPLFTVHFDETTLAQETAHTFDMSHASCDHSEESGGGCDPAPSVFPCPHGGICLSSSQLDEPYGFNTYNMAVLPPNKGPDLENDFAHDFMSYGAKPTWVSPYTYRRLFSKLRDALPGNSPQEATENSPVAEDGNQPQAPQPVLFVSGSISGTGTAGVFTTVYKLPQLALIKEGAGNYSLEIQNQAGQVLSRRLFTPFTLTEAAPGQELHFTELIALPAQAARLVLKSGGTVIAERQRSTNPPAVTLQSPAGGAVWGQNAETIQWQGSDGDGDALAYVVQYSPDLGATWTTLAVNQTQTSLPVDAGLLPGSGPNDALIRIFASDGFNSVSVQSAPFTVSRKAPFVNIFTPENGSVHQRGDLINFNGAATDLEDGITGDGEYHWRSNIDGDLGAGHDLNLRSLSIGRHTITLSVTDSNGQAGSDTIEIIVQETVNTQPLADATPYLAVPVGTEVTLNGQGSFDPDHDPLEYSWRLVSAPAGFEASDGLIDANTATPRLTVSISGIYVLELVVRDGQVNSNPARVVVQAAEHIEYLPVVMDVSAP